MSSGIYVIEHVESGRKYVGSSNDCERRWVEHTALLRKGRHHCITLQRAWDKYPESAFKFYVIEECAEDVLLKREQYWFDHWRPFAAEHNGFNENPFAAKPMPSNMHSEEARKRQAEWIRGKKRGPMSTEQKAKVSASKLGQRLNYTEESMAQRQSTSWEARRAAGTDKHSEETKAKLSAIRKKNPTKPELIIDYNGERITLKQYMALTGVTYACAYRRYCVGTLDGVDRRRSTETKAKLSESHKGQVAWNKGKLPWQKRKV